MEEQTEKKEIKEEAEEKEQKIETQIFGLRTTANREDQVMDFLTSNAEKKKYKVYSVIRPHGMRGYIFVEAETRQDAEQAAFNIPYARGILPKEIDYSEIEHMLEMVKVEMNIKKSDIVEIISGPFKREQAKVTRIDKVKEEVVVELLEAAVPIPITVKMDAVKVIRRESDDEEEEPEEENLAIPTPDIKSGPIEFKEENSGAIPMPGAQTTTESDATQEEAPEEFKMPDKEEKQDKKEKPKKQKIVLGAAAESKKESEELISGDDIESIDDISDEDVKEEEKKEAEEKKKEAEEEKKEEDLKKKEKSKEE